MIVDELLVRIEVYRRLRIIERESGVESGRGIDVDESGIRGRIGE
jgi:hypothetical protein